MALILAALVVSCGEAPEPVTVDIGVHWVSFVVPDGWHHYDHGREQRLETSDGDIVLSDLGPVTAEGYRAVVVAARGLFRRGRSEDAHYLLESINRAPVTDDAGLRSALDRGLDALGFDRPAEEVEGALASLLDRIDSLREPDLPWLANRVLADLNHGPRRDVEREQPLIVDNRDGRRILTWQRLTHDHRRRHVFVVNRGHLLVIRTDVGLDATLGPAFDTVLRSLVFVEPEDH